MSNKRSYTIIIGSKLFFDQHVESKFDDSALSSKSDFGEMVRRHDEFTKRISIKGVSDKSTEDFDKTDILIVRNHNYHGIVDTAHDRLGALIEDLTTDDACILVHNPTTKLRDYLQKSHALEKVNLICEREEYKPLDDTKRFTCNIESILGKIIGQDSAIREIAKSMWYLTKTDRRTPFVIMLYGNSGIGKSEMVREIASTFYAGKVFEKHLSMFMNNTHADYLFGDKPNRTSIGYDLLERESNLVFLDEFDKLPNYFHSIFYTLFDNTVFCDATYQVDISGLLVFLTSNYSNTDEMMKHLGLPIYYRIDRFIHFEDFTPETIYRIAKNEISRHVAESSGEIDADILYDRASRKLMDKGENARTIRNVVQRELESLLFEKVLQASIAGR